jgi:fatty-acyl-CoA synthase
MTRVRRLAGALAARGVKPGTRVAALNTNSHRYVEAYYATAMLGGVFVPVNYRAKRPELEHMLKSSEAQVLFVGERYLPEVDRLRSALPKLETLVGFERVARGMPRYETLLAARPRATEEAESTTTTRASSCSRAARRRCRRA